jgi:hypothetical protein
MLSTLHYSKNMQKVPVNQVSMTPLPGQSVNLAEFNAEMDKLSSGYAPPKTDGAYLPEAARRNSVAVPQGETPEAIAASLLTQSQILDEDAKSLTQDAADKRAQAYAMDPSLDPDYVPELVKPEVKNDPAAGKEPEKA